MYLPHLTSPGHDTSAPRAGMEAIWARGGCTDIPTYQRTERARAKQCENVDDATWCVIV